MTHDKNANNQEPTCDPIALILAAGVHKVEQPEATILFGSRAKGTQDESESDIDIMLAISSDLPDDSRWQQAQDRAQQTADDLYGRRVAVQLEYITTQNLESQGQYLDTPAGAALVHGVLAGGDPDHFKALYDRDNPPPPKYRFENYQWNTKMGLQALHAMLTYHRREPYPAGSTDSTIQMVARAVNTQGVTPEQIYGLVRNQAMTAVATALDAAQWATGTAPANRDTLTKKRARLATLLPNMDLQTRLPLDLYENPGAVPAMNRDEYVKAATADINRLRECAKKIRTRTAAGARKASRNAQGKSTSRTGH